jgi:MFS family permease
MHNNSQTYQPAATTLGRAQWLVLIASFLGWMFDGYELGLFPVVARPALKSMLANAGDGAVGYWIGIGTAASLVGAAFGGVAFGWLGDRIGRVRAMALSILTYSLVTGVGYIATEPWHLAAVRLVSALGMGGQWSLGVALVMECWPEKWRPALASAMGAASNIGFLLVGFTARLHPVTPDHWRWLMLVAAMPALLVVFIMGFVPESKRWQAAMSGVKAKPFHEIFSPALRRNTVMGILLASVALIGTWGSATWLPVWADQLAGPANPMAKADTQMVMAIGQITGAMLAPFAGALFGRRSAYFVLCLASLVICGGMFRMVHAYDGVFLVTGFALGAATASFYGFFPLYLPELFPTRARATGQGLCYNAGRIFAAAGALLQGSLVGAFGGSYAQAGAVVTLVYLLGMVLVWFAPETKGKPLPE